MKGEEEVDIHAAHAIIVVGVAPLFLSPVKKMLRVFAMLYDFFVRDSFFFKRLQKVVPSLIARAPNKFRSKNNVVCPPEYEDRYLLNIIASE